MEENKSTELVEQDMEEVCGECYDKVGYYDITQQVFQWLVDNDYVVCKKIK